MRVKIGDEWHDSRDKPIMVELTDQDKDLISRMGNQRRFCSYPRGADKGEIARWMAEENLQVSPKTIN